MVRDLCIRPQYLCWKFLLVAVDEVRWFLGVSYGVNPALVLDSRKLWYRVVRLGDTAQLPHFAQERHYEQHGAPKRDYEATRPSDSPWGLQLSIRQ